MNELVKHFIEWNFNLYQAMEQCDHGYFDDYGTSYYTPSKYHLEGSVWAHTMLSFNNYHRIYQEYDYGKAVKIMLLCHDIGKVYTRRANNEKKVVHFYNHAFAGIQDTVDFICYLEKIGYISKYFIRKYGQAILTNISNHMDYHFIDTLDFHMVNENISTYLMSNDMVNNDVGLFEEESNKNKKDFLKNCKTFAKNNTYLSDCDIVFYSGVPGSGKDFVAKKDGRVIVSFDDIRVNWFLSMNPDITRDSYDSNTLYHKAWNWCNEYKVDLNSEVKRKVKEYLLVGKKVAICNTLLTRKSRRKMINVLKGFGTIGCKHVCIDYGTMVERDLNRDKSIKEEVISKMCKNIQIPTMKEGFENVELIFNFKE